MQRLPLISLLAVPFTAACFNPGAKTDEDLAATNTDTPADSTGDVDSHGDSSPDGGDAPDDSSTTSGSPSDDDSATSDDTTTDSTPDPYCGDGTIDEGEECDDGENNGPGQACRADCQLNVCGDNDQGPDEACDDGPQNALELGACAPDCSKIIEAKEILLGSGVSDGNLGANPIAFMDSRCPVGYKALFAVPGQREATATPYAADNLVDWPLQPYTAYTTGSGAIVWITDNIPLLGVRNGAEEPLNETITTCAATCLAFRTVTGLNSNWTTNTTYSCNGWTNGTDASSALFGNPYTNTNYLSSSPSQSCEGWFLRAPYCIEQ